MPVGGLDPPIGAAGRVVDDTRWRRQRIDDARSSTGCDVRTASSSEPVKAFRCKAEKGGIKIQRYF